MTLRKWNYKTNQYEDFEVPNDRRILMYTPDLDEIIQCASCGKKLTYGESYSSMEIHNDCGMGYAVCDYCH